MNCKNCQTGWPSTICFGLGLRVHSVQNCGRYGGALKLNYIPTNGSSAPSVATVAVAATGGRGAETLLNSVVYCGAIHVPPD